MANLTAHCCEMDPTNDFNSDPACRITKPANTFAVQTKNKMFLSFSVGFSVCFREDNA